MIAQLSGPSIDTRRVAPAGVDTGRTGVVASVASLPGPIAIRLAEAAADHRLVEVLSDGTRAALAAALTAARDAGAQINELARAYELSKPTIYRLLREHAAGRPAGTPTTEEVARRVAIANQPRPVTRWELPVGADDEGPGF